MIPQFFVKSSGEQINFSDFDYVDGAQLIYDWGNIICYNPNQGSSGITYNGAEGSLGEPQGGFVKQGGGSAPLWVSTYSGSIDFTPATVADYYVEYNGTLPTGAISVVSVYKSDATDDSGSLLCLTGSNNGINLPMGPSKVITPKIWYGASGNTEATLTCTATLPNNDWNMVTFTSNGLNAHTMYLNAATSASVDTNTYDRGLFAPSNQNIRIGINNINSGNNQSLQGYMIATLIYPFDLSTKQIRQLYYVFRKRFS
jgi:hypothetical protein